RRDNLWRAPEEARVAINFEQIRPRPGYVVLLLRCSFQGEDKAEVISQAKAASAATITAELRAWIASQWAEHYGDMFGLAERLGIDRDDVRNAIVKFTEDQLLFVQFNCRYQAEADKAWTRIALQQYRDSGNSVVDPSPMLTASLQSQLE